jgi:hypothetical protein
VGPGPQRIAEADEAVSRNVTSQAFAIKDRRLRRSLQEEVPMRRLSLGRLLPILLASSLVLSTHSLWAQELLPEEEIQARIFDQPIEFVSVSGAGAHLGPVPGILPEAPRSRIESHVKFSPLGISFHINTQGALSFQQPTGAAELGKADSSTGRASNQWLTCAYGEEHSPTGQPRDPLRYYSRHIPWAGSIISRVSQKAKAHSHLTSVFELFQPQF